MILKTQNHEVRVPEQLLVNFIDQGFASINDLALKNRHPDDLKSLGATFTPEYITDFIVDEALNIWSKLNPKSSKKVTATDLCCGSGAFIWSLSRRLPKTSLIQGYEIDHGFCSVANRFFKNNKNISIEQSDSLLELDSQNESFDVVVGNPPYVRCQNLQADYIQKLRLKYPEYTVGNFDLAIPFIIKMFHSLNEGGVAGVIVSNKFLKSKYGKSLCNFLYENSSVYNIIDFGDNQLFKGKTTYTSILFFGKKKLNNSFKYTHFDTGTFTPDILNKRGFDSIILENSKLNSHPWYFKGQDHNIIMETIKLNGVALEKVFKVIQGVRTGANEAFIQKPTNTERDVRRKFINGQHILKGKFKETVLEIIYPYEILGNKSRIFSELELKKNFPETYSHLSSQRTALSERSIDGDASWFAFSRSQNINQACLPKIIAKELMPEAIFAADMKGEYVFSSGYGLINQNLTEEELNVYAHILCTDAIEFQLRKACVQIKDGWFRILKHHFEHIYLPVLSHEDIEKCSSIIKQDEFWPNLNNFINKLFKLDSRMEQLLKENLKKAPQKNKFKNKTVRPEYLSHLTSIDFEKYIPIELPEFYSFHVDRYDMASEVTFKKCKGQHRYGWYKYTQGYAPELVKELMTYMNVKKNETVFDPFVGSGTTVLAAKEEGVSAIGYEISPLMAWVGNQKLRDWNITLLREGIKKLKLAILPKGDSLLFSSYLKKAYAPQILKQIESISQWLEVSTTLKDQQRDFLKLALMSCLEEISQIRKHGSHYRFLDKDNVGVNKLNIKLINVNTDVRDYLIERASEMILDIVDSPIDTKTTSLIINDNAKNLPDFKFDHVITSPPYLNRNNYLAQQKAEFSVMKILSDEKHFKSLVQSTFRSHVEATLSKQAISSVPEVNEIIKKITLTENNNAKIPHMVAGYFDDFDIVLKNIYKKLQSGGKAAFVLGCTRWGGVVVPVDHLVALIGIRAGFEVDSIWVTRLKGNSPQQMKKFGKIPLRESIVILKKP